MKVKPRKGGRIRRRAITIAIYGAGWLLLTLLLPLWAITGLIIALVRRRHFIVLRLLFFGWFYFGFELLALLLIGAVYLRHRPGDARSEALYRLQAWWASVNLGMASRLLRLRIEVDGADCATPGPSIVLVRHASILDTLLPCAYVQRPYRLRVRYVVKQELLFDPCIDIVGNALPNYFVDRTGSTSEELAGIRALTQNLGNDAVLIFPEGTRFSRKKRERTLARLEAEGSAHRAAAGALRVTLPPKPGGVLTLLDALPDVDCVFLAHSGLERFAKIGNLLDGAVVGSTVRVKLWRVPRAEIPMDEGEQLGWLFDRWSEVDSFVGNALETSGVCSG
jgi:1-acyl-sn-glycerol-3-phosphate acyltransferase